MKFNKREARKEEVTREIMKFGECSVREAERDGRDFVHVTLDGISMRSISFHHMAELKQGNCLPSKLILRFFKSSECA